MDFSDKVTKVEKMASKRFSWPVSQEAVELWEASAS